MSAVTVISVLANVFSKLDPLMAYVMAYVHSLKYCFAEEKHWAGKVGTFSVTVCPAEGLNVSA